LRILALRLGYYFFERSSELVALALALARQRLNGFEVGVKFGRRGFLILDDPAQGLGFPS
jgi:hypothetical protein